MTYLLMLSYLLIGLGAGSLAAKKYSIKRELEIKPVVDYSGVVETLKKQLQDVTNKQVQWIGKTPRERAAENRAKLLLDKK